MTRAVTLDAVDLVLRVARATLGAVEYPPKTNGGPYVERVLKSTGNRRGEPWCAAWVYDIGNTALRSAWPVPRTASCYQVGEWAKQQGCRYLPSAGAQPGDLFLLYYGGKLNRFAHVGFVLSVNADKSIVTLEGNTSQPGDTDPATSREGWQVASKTRRLSAQDRLVRWVDVLK